ncbi:MAG: hypothetical protein U5L03_16745 [Burkholderiaceae bacterium]|nr:hypothetical protein [Burkholderiaceae bacterium]
MSVLNQMLNDLSTRGALLPAGGTTIAPGVVAGGARHAHRLPAASISARRVAWPTLALSVVAVVGALLWTQQQAQDARLTRQPLGMASLAPVAVAAPAAPLDTSVAAAREPAPAVAEAAETTAAAVPPAGSPSATAPVATVAVASTEPAVASAPPARATPPVVAAKPTARAMNAAPAQAPSKASPPPATEAKDIAVGGDDTPPAVQRRTGSGPDIATDMARAAELISRGRNTEAIDLLRTVLARDASHAQARTALAALLAEAGRRDLALSTLLDGVRIDAARYAAPAAGLQSELGDATGALATLGTVPAAQRTAAHEALAGGLAYRAGQFGEATAAYRRALAAPDAQPLWWLGLGLALEAAGQRAEAHAAFTRLAHAPALPADVQRFVAQRLAANAPAAARAAANPPTAADSLAAGAAR